MGIVAIIFFLFFMTIHTINHGDISEIIPIMIVAIGVWMIDISIMLASIAVRSGRK